MAQRSERGAVAVEFAIVLPVLLLLVMGVMEFGRAFNAQITLTNAAREGVRVMAINNERTPARTAAKNAAVSLNPALADSNIAFSSSSCTAGAQMTVTISYRLSTITGVAGPFDMTGKGVMLCGG